MRWTHCDRASELPPQLGRTLPNHYVPSSKSAPIPVQHSESAEGVPPAGLADPGFHVEGDPIGVKNVQRPPAVLVPFLLHQLDRLGDPFVGFDAGAPQVVKSPCRVESPKIGRMYAFTGFENKRWAGR